MKKIITLLSLAVSLVIGKAETLSWNPNPETNIVSYNVFRSVNGSAFTKIATVAHPDTNEVLTLTNGNTYAFQVTAVNNAALESLPSATVSVFLPAGVPPENTIVSRSIGDFQAGSWRNVAFSWPAVDFAKYGITNYVVNVKNTASGVVTKTTVTVNNINFASLVLADYEFYVTTENSLGVSPVGPNSTWVLSSRRPNAPLGVKLQ